MKVDFYDILGVSKECTPEELKKAYRKLCKEHHPDQDGDREVFESIKKAYDTLIDPVKREQYDLYGENDEELKMLIGCAITIFKKAIALDNPNIETDITTVYKEMVQIGEDNIKSCNKDILKNESIINKIIHAPKNDFIGNLLKSEIIQNQEAIKSFKQSIEDIGSAYEMLTCYMFDNFPKDNPLLDDSFSEWLKTGTGGVETNQPGRTKWKL